MSCNKSLSRERKFLEWISDEDYFNIPVDEIDEILEDYVTYLENNFK